MTHDTETQNVKRANSVAKSAAQFVARDVTDAAQDIVDTVSDAAVATGHSIKEQAATLAARAGEIAGDVKDRAVEAAGSARAAAVELADQKATTAKDSLADEGHRLADTMRSSAAARGQTLQAKVIEVAAGSVDAFADTLSGRSISDLMADVQTYARRHPGVFVAGAALAGFALARFVRSGGGHDLASGSRQT